MLDERNIKAAVIDRLMDTGELANAVLINEMVYANWKGRADLAVANGHLQAFEIKSDLDSLRRLDRQIEIYLERFEKLTLVVSLKFLKPVLQLAPQNVGVWVAFEENSTTHLKVIRHGKKKKIEDRMILIDYLLRDEIYNFLSSQQVNVRRSDPRSHLANLAKTQPISKLRAYMLNAIKARFDRSFNDFLAVRDGLTSPENIFALRKAKQTQADSLSPEHAITGQQEPQHKKIQLTLSKLFPDGEIPSIVHPSLSVRKKVLKRKTRDLIA